MKTEKERNEKFRELMLDEDIKDFEIYSSTDFSILARSTKNPMVIFSAKIIGDTMLFPVMEINDSLTEYLGL